MQVILRVILSEQATHDTHGFILEDDLQEFASKHNPPVPNNQRALVCR